MFGILPLIGLAMAVICFYGGAGGCGWRQSLLEGMVLWGCFITAMTEILSLCHCLDFAWVLAGWLLWILSAAFFLSRQGRALKLTVKVPGDFSFAEKVFLASIVLIALILSVITLLAPPNTADAMTYHLGRVVHWVQDKTVAYYPTHILRQLFSPPWAEYAVFQFQVLSRADCWANFVQWLCMAGSLAGVSLIARELGAGRFGQILSALYTATIPMGIVQATSTQTDYAVTLWLCIFVYFFIRWKNSCGWREAFFMAAALGLGILTKGTMVVFALPFLAWAVIVLVRQFNFKCLAMIVTVLCVAAALCSGMLYRNYKLFEGNFFMAGPETVKYTGIDSLVNDHFSMREEGGNLLRNFGSEMVTPWEKLNKLINGLVLKVSDFCGLDLNNASGFQGSVFRPNPFTRHEDCAESPLQVLLLALSVVAVIVFSPARKRQVIFYSLALLAMIFVFSLVLKWQYWIVRFHLSVFVMAAPLVGAVLEKLPWRPLVSAVMAAVMIYALPYIFENPMKSFVTPANIFSHKDRALEYFSPAELARFKEVGLGLSRIQCRDLGLLTTEYAPEYPVWRVLNPGGLLRIEHVMVDNVSSAGGYPLGEFSPCAVLALSINVPSPGFRLGKDVFVKVLSGPQGALSLFLKYPLNR